MWLLGAEQARAKKSYLVIGLGYFGAELAVRLTELGQEVVGVDPDPSIVQHLADKLTQAIEMDATDPSLLETLGVENFDICIVGRGSDLEDSVIITMGLKELGAKYVIAKAVSHRQARILERLGIDMIVFPELDMARNLAEALTRPRVVGEIELADGYVVEALRVTDRFIGQEFRKLKASLPVGSTVLGLQKGSQVILSPSEDAVVEEGEILLVYGRPSRLAALEQ